MDTEAVIPEFNILLLGETGAGKSMLINAFTYYAICDNFDEAKTNEQPCQIPFQFKFKDKAGVDHQITEGPIVDNRNETLGGVKSATRSCTSYPFSFQDYKVRLIDTAGVGATEGITSDEENIQDVLEFISNFQNLNAIGIVIQSNRERCTVTFKYCIKQLLMNLDKGAVSNILFIFTFSEVEDYEVGPAKNAIQEILNELKDNKAALGVTMSKENMFCFENKWLKYRAAFRRGFSYKSSAVRSCEDAWVESHQEYKRLLDYVIGLELQPGLQPHNVNNIVSINDAKKYIKIIYPLFDDILLSVAKNKYLLGEQQTDLENGLIKELKPIRGIQYRELLEPKTICRSEKCREKVLINGKILFDYPQTCCPGCTVPFGLRLFCKQMELISGQCKVMACQCPVNDHLRIHYIKEEFSKEILKASDLRNIEKATSRAEMVELMRKVIESQRFKLEDEASIVKNAMLIFSKFLQSHTIAPPSSDVLEVYKQMEDKARKSTIKNKKKNTCTLEKLVQEMAETVDESWTIKPQNINNVIVDLVNMEFYGEHIQNAYKIQKEAYLIEHTFVEKLIFVNKYLSRKVSQLFQRKEPEIGHPD